MAFKAVVLVGGPQKGLSPQFVNARCVFVKCKHCGDLEDELHSGTRFRPLSLQLPKPLFPIAGVPLVEHHIDQLSQLPGLSEIILIGSYSSDLFTDFIDRCQQTYRISIKYAQEQQPLGTAGGLVAHKDTIIGDSPEGLFVINGDVCGDLPVDEMVTRIASLPSDSCLLLTTEATREQSGNFGNVSSNRQQWPCCALRGQAHDICFNSYFLWSLFNETKRHHGTESRTRMYLWFETDIFPQMACNGKLFALHTTRWWSQTKTAAAVLYANRHYLRLFKKRYAARLCKDRAQIVGDVFIDPSAEVHKSAKIGPNVSIGPNAKIGKGVRIKESIILADAVINEHACVLHSVIGWRSVVGAWSRVEGIPIAPNPNLPFAKLENKPLFLSDGRLNPSLTILGSDVSIAPETIVLNCVVLPYKELSCSYKNQIIL
ncbi:bacterial transferase hexapeptide repeat protein [Ostertagia ostertagi]